MRLIQAASKFFGPSLNYVGEFRQRIWPLFLCVSVVGSENSGSPQKAQKIQRISGFSSSFDLQNSDLLNFSCI